ncbi:MAG: Kae1-associated serine/threonine protein kinase [Candidatus Bathyarchaeota archaeon]|nr:MAG: Kae1-associated serine/threonine protein kinase [Candidatus Bathyarchaeota archaeon]
MLIKKGAEANLYLEDWHGRKVILKRRLPKKYRVPELDKEIRFYRTIHEPQHIHKAKEAGVPTPTIFMVDVVEATIVMEFIEGKQVKQILDGLSSEERQHLCRYIGELIGRLHNHRVIHGDLTTSNMILTSQGRVVFVDFGLSERSIEVEAKGVDLNLMKRAFQSIHFKYAEECFDAVFEGYAQVVGGSVAKKVLEKVREIGRRGRYVSER